MKKFPITRVAPLIFVGVVLTLVIILLPWSLRHDTEEGVQRMADDCVERGDVASWSFQSSWTEFHSQFTCLAKPGN